PETRSRGQGWLRQGGTQEGSSVQMPKEEGTGRRRQVAPPETERAREAFPSPPSPRGSNTAQVPTPRRPGVQESSGRRRSRGCFATPRRAWRRAGRSWPPGREG